VLVPVVVAPPVPELVDPPVVVPLVGPELLDPALVLPDAAVDVPLVVVLDEDALVPTVPVELPAVDPDEDAELVLVLLLTEVVVPDWPEEQAPASNPATASAPTRRTWAEMKGRPPMLRQHPTLILIATPIETAQR
jgi:hypothetical protein